MTDPDPLDEEQGNWMFRTYEPDDAAFARKAKVAVVCGVSASLIAVVALVVSAVRG